MAYGNHFEDLFSKLMKQKYGLRYQAISTYGRDGDRLRETLRPETIRIRKKIWKLLEDLYSYKQL